jgi:hypothetical protein
MPLHQYGLIQYDMWDGPPPPLVGEQVSESVKPGVDGVAHAFVGKWGPPFDRTLTAVLPTYEEAFLQQEQQRAMLGYAWGIIYHGVNYTAEFSHVYRAIDCEVLEIRKIIRFLSLDKNYVYPTQIVTRWKLAPISLE